MARIRTIKPDFWKHELLSELPPDTHMLAASLLNYSDDEGYFNANPKLIVAECCPLRDLSVTVQCMLTSLVEIDYLKVGQCEDGRKYGHVVNFLEHQVINRPKPSKIKELKIDWDISLNNHGAISDSSSLEGKGREGKGKEEDSIVVLENDEQNAFDLWNILADEIGLAKVQKITKPRLSKMKARLKDCDGIEGWKAALGIVRASSFLSGEKTDWKADIDFLLTPSKFTKIMEGSYNDNGNSNNQARNGGGDILAAANKFINSGD